MERSNYYLICGMDDKFDVEVRLSVKVTVYHFPEFVYGLQPGAGLLPAVLARVVLDLFRGLAQLQLHAVVWLRHFFLETRKYFFSERLIK